MRLSTMLDTISTGGSGPWTPTRSSAGRTVAPTTGPTEGLATTDTATNGSWVTDEGFRQLVDRTIPCRSNDPELWFAEKSADVDRAKALCQQCPLAASCLAGALERREPWGVWGGEVFVDGVVVARKRGRGRPSNAELAARRAAEAQAEAVQEAVRRGAA